MYQNIYAIGAKSYIVMDLDNDNVLMGYNYHDKSLIASTTKILTCIIALENSNLDDIIKTDENILKVTGSSIYLSLNEKISMRDLVYGMMLRSGNDASTMIALHISSSMENFASIMNEYAKKIGMNDSIFYNSHGLEDNTGQGNISSAYDLAILTSYAMKNEEFRKIFNTDKYVAKSDIKTYHWTNKNKLLKYNYVTGGKTGYTKKAGRILVTTGNINNMNVVIVSIKDPDDWQDHISLYEKVKNEYQNIQIINHNDLYQINNEKYYVKNDYYYTLKKCDINKLYNRYEFRDNEGYIKIYLNNKLIYEDILYVKKKQSKFISWLKKIFRL